MKFSPRAPQQPIVDFALTHERCNIWASMGLGKSSASIYVYDALRMFGEAKRALILAPKRVAVSTWPGEIDKFRESFGHLKIAAAIGTPEERRRAIMSKPDILCINYDNVEWLIDGYGDDWPFDMVIADEATRLKGLRIGVVKQANGKEHLRGQGSVRAKALAKIAHKRVRRWVNLTGSPAPNGLQDLWGQQFFIDGGRRLGTSFDGFTDRWFRSVKNADGYSQIEPLKYADPEIKALLKDCTLTVDFADYFPIDKPFEHVKRVPLPPAARRIYDSMERELFAELQAGVPIQAFNAGGKLQKCLQIGNGTVYDSERVWHPVHDAKLEMLESIVAESAGEPILIRYTHIPDRERILKAFPRFKVLDDKQETQDRWNAGKIPGLLTHAASAGHGLNLQDGGRIMVDFCTDFNLEHDEQIIERIGPTRQFQSGHPRPVHRYRIVAEDTIEDHSAVPRIKTKQGVQDSLKDAMKLRR
jgi:SNF2 family DNA or RNA helicase